MSMITRQALVSWFGSLTWLAKIVVVFPLVVILGLAIGLWFIADQSHYTEGNFEDVKVLIDKGDYASAIHILRPLADRGDARAQYNLGMMHAEGWGYTESDDEAIVWFRRSAAQGYTDAQVMLGTMYRDGRGVAKDYARAWYWLDRAAQPRTAGDTAAKGTELAKVLRDDMAKYSMNAAQMEDAKKFAREMTPEASKTAMGSSTASPSAKDLFVRLNQVLQGHLSQVQRDIAPCDYPSRPEDLQACRAGLENALQTLEKAQKDLAGMEARPTCEENIIRYAELGLEMAHSDYQRALQPASRGFPDLTRRIIRGSAGTASIDKALALARNAAARGGC